MEIPNVKGKNNTAPEEKESEIYQIFGMKLRVVKEQEGTGGTRFSCIHCALSNMCFKCQDEFEMGNKFMPCLDAAGNDYRHFEKVED